MVGFAVRLYYRYRKATLESLSSRLTYVTTLQMLGVGLKAASLKSPAPNPATYFTVSTFT